MIFDTLEFESVIKLIIPFGRHLITGQAIYMLYLTKNNQIRVTDVDGGTHIYNRPPQSKEIVDIQIGSREEKILIILT